MQEVSCLLACLLACSDILSFVRPHRRLSSAPTANFGRRRAQWRSRMARLRATASAARSVLDGCEHDGMLDRVGAAISDNQTIKSSPQKAIKKRADAYQESWQRIGGESPPLGKSSQPPRPRVMHEVLLARAAVKRSQGRPRAEY